jgi:hypothetical protein
VASALILVLAIAALVFFAIRRRGGTQDASDDSGSPADAKTEFHSVSLSLALDGCFSQFHDELSFNLELTMENPTTVRSGDASAFLEVADVWE